MPKMLKGKKITSIFYKEEAFWLLSHIDNCVLDGLMKHQN